MSFRKLRQKVTKECDDIRCWYCGRCIKDKEITFDHVVPKAHGGTDDPSNLVCCCALCNRLKGQKSLEEFEKLMLICPISTYIPLDNPTLISKYHSHWDKSINRIKEMIEKYSPPAFDIDKI